MKITLPIKDVVLNSIIIMGRYTSVFFFHHFYQKEGL